MLTKDFARLATSTVAVAVYVLLVLQLPTESVWFAAAVVFVTCPPLLLGLMWWNHPRREGHENA